MAKQVVTLNYSHKAENGGWNSCDITTSLDFDDSLKGTKEYQDVVVYEDEKRKIVKHWVRVANDPVKSVTVNEHKKFVKELKINKEIAQKRQLHAIKRERMEKYAQQIKEFGEIRPTHEDTFYATQLQSMIGRSKVLFKDILHKQDNSLLRSITKSIFPIGRVLFFYFEIT